ncbi:MAG: hypothetical protein AAGD05_09595, partial [Bacteroidota bacterium]
KHRLWIGFWEYGWASRFLLLLGLIVGLKFMDVFQDWWNHADMHNPLAFTSSMGSLIKDVTLEGYNLFYLVGLKYFILILMEIVIFHFARKTLEIIRSTQVDASFKTFVRAEIRMIKVVLISFVLETILTFIVGLAMQIGGIEYLKFIPVFLIQCYFLGFVVIDNYNEIFGMSIRESERYTRDFMGLAVALGLITYVILLVPILGAAIAPLLAGVTATLAMNELTKDEAAFSIEAIQLEEEY